MSQLNDHLPGMNLGVFQDLPNGIYGANGYPGFGHSLNNLRTGHWSERSIDDRPQLVVIGQPVFHSFETRIGCQLRKPQNATEVGPLLLICNSDIQESIFCLKRFVWNDRWMPRSHSLR